MARQQPVLRDLLAGAIAGAVATWAMDRATTLMYERENRAARAREDEARQGKTTYGVAAEKAAGALGVTLTEEERDQRYGPAIHWALGVGAGALYGLLRPRLTGAALARGLGFGTAFWLLMDETVTPMLGLTPGPTAFPWQTHARGLAGHLVFGAVADAALRPLQPAT